LTYGKKIVSLERLTYGKKIVSLERLTYGKVEDRQPQRADLFERNDAKMRIAFGNDHRGYSVRTTVFNIIQRLGHEVVDVGTDTAESVDYPEIAARLCAKITSGEADAGILVCGTGIGMCIAANKFPGIRAAPCHDILTAEMSRRHNNANVLCLSADLIGERRIDDMVETWVATEFEGGRHERRLEKIAEMEEQIQHEGCEDS